MSRRGLAAWPLAAVVVVAAWAVWSFFTGGVMSALVSAALRGDASIDGLRRAIEAAGVWAPVVYVAAVVVEVMVAPIPGLLLYLPGGALFGGFWGGTLALVGNVIGAALATWLAGTVGERLLTDTDWPRLRQYGERIQARGLLIVILLRINPLTSSDLVSYAAGLVGVPVWRVALGTAIGMAPLCYAQAYASEWVFRWVPASGLVIALLALGYCVVVFAIMFRSASKAADTPGPRV